MQSSTVHKCIVQLTVDEVNVLQESRLKNIKERNYAF